MVASVASTSLASNSPLRCSSHRCSSSCRESIAFAVSGRVIVYSLLLLGQIDLDPPREVRHRPGAGHAIALHGQRAVAVGQALSVERPDQIGPRRGPVRELHLPEDFLSLDLHDPEHVVTAQRLAPVPQIPDHFPDHSPTSDCGLTGVCAMAAATVKAAIVNAINTEHTILSMSLSF